MYKLVTEKSGKLVTTSLKVAEVFEKRHSNILRDIATIKRVLTAIDNNPLKFELVNYQDTKGENRPMYEMDRDAFALLVFGFNGPRAVQFKIDFIQEFNAMELEQMKAQKMLVNSKDLPALLRMAADTLETTPAVPKPQFKLPEGGMTLTKIPRNGESTAVRKVLKNLGLKPRKTTDYLAQLGYLTVVPRDKKGTMSSHKKPTIKGEKFFFFKGTGLHIKSEGIRMLRTKLLHRTLPEDCMLDEK